MSTVLSHAAVIAAVVISSSTMAAASSLAPLFDTGIPCEVTSVSGAASCAGIFGKTTGPGAATGNDSNSDLDGLFGFTGWTEVLKLDSSSGTESGGGIELTVTNTKAEKTWEIDTYGGYDPVMFVTKGGPSFSAFLMDLTVLSGTWDTNSMLTGGKKPVRGADLSHWTIYQAERAPVDPDPGPQPIPLPAAGWLLVAGIGGLVGLRRRRG